MTFAKHNKLLAQENKFIYTIHIFFIFMYINYGRLYPSFNFPTSIGVGMIFVC